MLPIVMMKIKYPFFNPDPDPEWDKNKQKLIWGIIIITISIVAMGIGGR